MSNTITNAGNAAILTSLTSAGVTGPGFQLQVTTCKLGATNPAFDPTLTDVPGGVVYMCSTGQMTATQLNSNTILYYIELDESVGNFAYGSVGLYLSDGTLLTYVSLPEIRTKTANNFPSVLGNDHSYYIPVTVTSSSTAFTLSLPQTVQAEVPSVASEAYLPDPTTAPYNAYVLRASAAYAGTTTLAITNGSAWTQICNPASSMDAAILAYLNGLPTTAPSGAGALYWSGNTLTRT